MKVNLKMLSESLGLSQTTVSRALNGYTDVAEATRRRVKEAAAAMGYQPDPLARRLATGRTDTIGMVFPFNATEFGDHRFGEVVAGLTEGLAKHNMDLSIIPTRPESELETYARMIDSRRVDAFIVGWTQVTDPRIALLQARGFPFLAYGRTETRKAYAWFDFDNEAGARMAVERLIALGHRRVAIIHAPLDYNFAAQRFAGYLAALAAAGIARDDSLVADARLIAAAGPLRASAGTANTGTATVTSGEAGPGYQGAFAALPISLQYNAGELLGFPVNTRVSIDGATAVTITALNPGIAYTSGATVTVVGSVAASPPAGFSFVMTGLPNNGDRFSIEVNTGATADGRNALTLAQLQTQRTMSGQTASYQDAYARLVSETGNRTRQLQVSSDAQQNLLAQAQASRDSLAAVNLDEEAANLIRYQQAYQASARAFQIGAALFDTILELGR